MSESMSGGASPGPMMGARSMSGEMSTSMSGGASPGSMMGGGSMSDGMSTSMAGGGSSGALTGPEVSDAFAKLNNAVDSVNAENYKLDHLQKTMENAVDKLKARSTGSMTLGNMSGGGNSRSMMAKGNMSGGGSNESIVPRGNMSGGESNSSMMGSGNMSDGATTGPSAVSIMQPASMSDGDPGPPPKMFPAAGASTKGAPSSSSPGDLSSLLKSL